MNKNKLQDDNQIEVGGAIHLTTGRVSRSKEAMFEFSIQPHQLLAVVEQLRQKGSEASWVVFMFYTPIPSVETEDDCPNLQYSILDGKVGIDWILLGPRNIADKVQVSQFIASKGHTITEIEMNGVPFLRVENGDVARLGQSIIEEFYRMPVDADVGILLHGFSLSGLHSLQ